MAESDPTAGPSPKPVAEATLRAVLSGIALGLVFGAANAYLGLRVALTVSASIPAAVMTVALFRAAGTRPTLLEANLSQTIGSASTSLATGTIFTIPALFLWGLTPPLWQVAALCFLGGVLGLSAMIPLRRMLVVDAHAELPYPEGTACAEVLRATAATSPEAAAGGVWIFRGMALGAVVKLAIALLFLVPGEVSVDLPFLPNGRLGLELGPALIAVGFILGQRQAAILVAGSVISSLVLIPLITVIGAGLTTPLAPEAVKLVSQMDAGMIWSRYVRYIGAGAVAAAGLFTVMKNAPAMAGAFGAVARGVKTKGNTLAQKGAAAGLRGLLSRDTPPDPERDLPASFVGAGIAFVVLCAAFVPGLFGTLTLTQRLVCAGGVGLFGVLFVAVAARIVGIVGVSSQPTSGITLVTLIGLASVFAAMGWTSTGERAAVLMVGTIVAVAASKAGDISQDLKTGFLVGATPARQQLGQLLGAAAACFAVAATVQLLGRAYTFGSPELPAPQATLMKTIVEGVLSGKLPWGLVLSTSGNTGIGLALVCAQRGYPLVVVMPETFSVERRRLMRFLGAKVVLTPAALRAKGLVDKTKELAAKHGWFFARQFENPANPAVHMRTTAREILADFKDRPLDYFVLGYGTGGTLQGVSRVLAEESPRTKIVVAEPETAQLLASGKPQERHADGTPSAAHPAWTPHPIQGWTPDFIPKVTGDAVAMDLIDEVIPVSGPESIKCSQDLATKEGIFCGISSGGSFACALKVAAKAPAGSVILCLLADTGERYLSTPLFENIPVEMTEEEKAIFRSTPLGVAA